MKIKRTRKRRGRRVRYRGKYLSTKMNVEMTYRSGWELSYFKYLDSLPQVVAFYSESLKIPYVSNKKSGKTRNYIPDLLVEYVDKKELVEIKPSKRVKQVTNQKKFSAARSWCIVNGVEFIVITEIDLKALGLM